MVTVKVNPRTGIVSAPGEREVFHDPFANSYLGIAEMDEKLLSKVGLCTTDAETPYRSRGDSLGLSESQTIRSEVSQTVSHAWIHS